MKNIIMDITPNTTRTALVENGKLVEVLIDDFLNQTYVGNIYAGRVDSIFGQFAFIDIGQEKKAFLQLDDIRQKAIYEEKNGIRKLNLKVGQQLIVQILKDPINEKGATVTTELSFTGRYTVLIKTENDKQGSIFVSKKIDDSAEVERLNQIALECLPKGYNMIMRTNCTGVSQLEIKEEIEELFNTSNNLLLKSSYVKPPALIYGENLIYASALKSLLKNDINNIITNSHKEFENIKSFVSTYYKTTSTNIKLYQGKLNIFDEYEIETQIEKALNKKVWLKSGGFLIIEETEACVIIDVNTGKLTSKKNKNDVILKNNIEAATEISKQLMLRNLSGIIIIDFIDMKSENEKSQLMSHLHKVVKTDRVGVNIVGMTSLGLVQLTRKKTRKPLSKYLLCRCENCQGTGVIYSTEYIVNKIYNQVCKILNQTIFNSVTIKVHNKIYNEIKNRNEDFKTLEENFNATVSVKKINTTRLDYFEIEKEKI